MSTYFVLSTSKLGERLFFAGCAEFTLGVGVILSDLIFNAFSFATEAEALEAAVEFKDYGFEPSSCTAGMSKSLRKSRGRA